jgi:hypothetical protein
MLTTKPPDAGGDPLYLANVNCLCLALALNLASALVGKMQRWTVAFILAEHFVPNHDPRRQIHLRNVAPSFNDVVIM